MATKYPTKPLYKLKNASAQGWVYAIKKDGLYWPLYKIFSSHRAAINGMTGLLPTRGKKSGLAHLTVQKTEKGWGVFQCSRHKQYQITDKNVGEYLVK